MTSAAASCPSATRALSAERLRRTRFASCRACAGCERVARLFALIDSLPVCRWNSAPRAPLSRGDRGHNRLSAALAALNGVPGPAPHRARRWVPGASVSKGWPVVRLREQQNWSHKHPRVDSPSHRPHGQSERARLVHTHVHVTLPAPPSQPTLGLEPPLDRSTYNRLDGAAASEHEHQRRRADRQNASFPAGAEARDRLLLAVPGRPASGPRRGSGSVDRAGNH